jgi:hypothetical protein
MRIASWLQLAIVRRARHLIYGPSRSGSICKIPPVISVSSVRYFLFLGQKGLSIGNIARYFRNQDDLSSHVSYFKCGSISVGFSVSPTKEANRPQNLATGMHLDPR